MAVALGGSVAQAAPKGAAAKAAFDRGLAAYQRGEFGRASASLGKSFTLEADVETLFAWAQSERQLDHCAKAIGLYKRLLKYNLPAANVEVINTRLEECKVLLATKPDPDPEPDPEPDPVETQPEAPPKPELPKPSEDRPWWQDPVGDTLVLAGGVGVGVGIGYLLAASSADAKKVAATSADDFAKYSAQADRDGTIGVASLVVGSAALVGGLAWYAFHRHHDDPVVTGWLTPTGSGVAVLGRF